MPDEIELTAEEKAEQAVIMFANTSDGMLRHYINRDKKTADDIELAGLAINELIRRGAIEYL